MIIDSVDAHPDASVPSGPGYVGDLLRHFADLRDGTHHGAASRRDKERLYIEAVVLIDPVARQVLDELNTELLLDTGTVSVTGVQDDGNGGHVAVWALAWPEQKAAGVSPIEIRAYFGIGFLHPHLRGATLGDWPLNVSNEERAAAELPTLRAIASADIHNLVFQTGGDYRIIPAVLSGRERG